MIGEVSPEMRRLVQVTKECMEIGIATAQPWARLGDVGAAIQEHAEKTDIAWYATFADTESGCSFMKNPMWNISAVGVQAC